MPRGRMIYARKGDIITRAIAGETILVPIRSRLADMEHLIVLEGIGDFVWSLMDGKTDLAAIVDAVLAEFDVGRAQAAADVRTFAETLSEVGLVEAKA